MKTIRQFLLIFAAGLVGGAGARAQTLGRVQTVILRAPAAGADTNADAPQQFRCSGTVRDADGRPVTGATVEYWRYEGRPPLQNHLELKKCKRRLKSAAGSLG